MMNIGDFVLISNPDYESHGKIGRIDDILSFGLSLIIEEWAPEAHTVVGVRREDVIPVKIHPSILKNWGVVSLETKRIRHNSCPFCKSEVQVVRVKKNLEMVEYDCGLILSDMTPGVYVSLKCNHIKMSLKDQSEEIREAYS